MALEGSSSGRAMPPVAALGLLLPLAGGCVTAEVQSVRAPDPKGPALYVECLVDGLAHHASYCTVEAATSTHRAEAGVPLDPSVRGPQRVEAKLKSWRKVRDPRQPVPDEVVRVRFLYKRARLHEVVFAEPAFDPEGVERSLTGRTAGPDDDPREGKEVEEEPAEAEGGPPPGLSDDLADPTGLTVRADGSLECEDERLVKDGELVLGVSRESGPQYARIDTEPGRLELTVDVASQGEPRDSADPTWWRVELLDSEGLELAEPTQEFGFIEVGDNIRTVLTWGFDGPGHILKVASGSARGDVVRIAFKPDAGSRIGPR